MSTMNICEEFLVRMYIESDIHCLDSDPSIAIDEEPLNLDEEEDEEQLDLHEVYHCEGEMECDCPVHVLYRPCPKAPPVLSEQLLLDIHRMHVKEEIQKAEKRRREKEFPANNGTGAGKCPWGKQIE
jgi:hypothetical protein